MRAFYLVRLTVQLRPPLLLSGPDPVIELPSRRAPRVAAIVLPANLPALAMNIRSNATVEPRTIMLSDWLPVVPGPLPGLTQVPDPLRTVMSTGMVKCPPPAPDGVH